MMKSSVFILAASLCVHLNDASLCKPLSSFVIDCNSCICSKNGMEYSCSDNMCPPKQHHENYDVKDTKDGYKLLVPKDSNQLSLDYGNFVLNKKHRVPRVPDGYPYISDEIPSSKESRNYEKEYNNIYKRDNSYNDESDSNDIDDKYNYDIERKYKNYNAKIKEIENNDLTFEEADKNEDTDWISEEDDSDDSNEDDNSNEVGESDENGNSDEGDKSDEDGDSDEDRDSDEGDNTEEDGDSDEDGNSDEDGDSDNDVDSENTVRQWNKIIPSARGRFHRE